MGLTFWVPGFECLTPDEREERADFQSPFYWDNPLPELASERADGLFHVGAGQDGVPARTLVCNSCQGTQFNVGVGTSFAAIRCPRCGWEKGVVMAETLAP
jgi:hypothetical protein